MITRDDWKANDLETGDVLFCKRKSFLSWAIRLLTTSKYSHTALFIELYGSPYVIEAQKNGVALKTFKAWTRKYKYQFAVCRKLSNTSTPQTQRIKELVNTVLIKKALSKSGIIGYDFESLLLRHPLKIFTGKWKVESTEQELEKMYCSEYVAWVHGLDQIQITPGELFHELLSNPDWIYVK